MKIKKLLIANRGEIALRILRTARELGYPIVAVYSDQDKDAAHVALADQRVHLYGNTLSDTYLNISAIIKAAKDTGADAIHPGYGFLSENPLFAKACETEGILFIGPDSSAISAMGNKIAARKIAIEHGIPVTPGITGSVKDLFRDHSKIGFPMLIKAAAGGGGKAMRVVMNDTELESAIMTTASEAENYFSDSTIYVERFFINPRHIEVQILGDKHGNIIHLFERECSMQRRHQKIIEEAPSVTLTPAIREKICSAAVQMAGSINYHSAGTIEFLVDNELNFYFLEMNTRIQVEHPVTETITGIDIVKEQFLIAEGNPLSIKQEDVSIKGHAIETRIYAENPASNFMPSPGKIQYYSYPQNPCIRIEEPKFHHDSEVFSNFDPMISKVIALGENRESAIKELTEYLPHYAILGINTNIPFLISLLNNKDYQQNRIHTRYIDDRLTEINANALILKDSLDKEIPLISAMIYSLNYTNKNHQAKRNIWEQIGYWRLYRQINLTLDEVHYNLVLNSLKVSTVSYNWNGKESYASLRKSDDGSFVLELNDKQHIIYLSGNSQNIIVQYSGFIFTVKRLDISVDDSNTFSAVQSYNPDSGDIIAPMPGRVLKINVNAGDRVTKGSLLMVVEAMKMENNILSPFDGVIDRIMVKQGDNIDPSSHLVHLAKIEDEVSGS